MGQPRLTTKEFESAFSRLIASASNETSSRMSFDDDVFDKVSHLLACVERQDWSLRPRTYVLLRMINRPDHMHNFVRHGLRDIDLPYNQNRLPRFLDDVSRHMFMEKQRAVLTKANDLELEKGRHRHFGASADRYFHILGTLGSGISGVVDHVQSKLSISRFARKRIHRGRSAIGNREATRSFENELENLKRLRHRHLVAYIGSYTDPHYVGILTTPVADYDLQWFLEQTPFPANKVCLLRQFFGCLCSAVQYLHCNKCRHKDIKPGNILVKNGEVYLTDFGTARDWSNHTTGTTVGRSGPFTPRYAAPEVVNWEPRNQSADVWSLGCVYLDMLTVIKGKTVNEMIDFFLKSGSGGRSPQNNRQALDLWLNQLKADRQDNEPIQWITQMLDPIRSNRPSAESLLEMIFGYEDEHVYYGFCCSTLEESDLESSYDSSELLDEANSESAFGAVSPLPLRAEEQHDGSRTGDPQNEEDLNLARTSPQAEFRHRPPPQKDVTVEPTSSSERITRMPVRRSPISERHPELDSDDSGRERLPSVRTLQQEKTARYTYPVETETRRPHLSRATTQKVPERHSERDSDDSDRQRIPSARTLQQEKTARYTYPVETETHRPHLPRATAQQVPSGKSPQKDVYKRGHIRTYGSPHYARRQSHDDRGYERSSRAGVLYADIPKHAGTPLRRDEIPTIRPGSRRGDSYTAQDVQYARKFVEADAHYAPRQ